MRFDGPVTKSRSSILGPRIPGLPPINNVGRHPPLKLGLELTPRLVLVVIDHCLGRLHIQGSVSLLQLKAVYHVEQRRRSSFQQKYGFIALLLPFPASVPFSNPFPRVPMEARGPKVSTSQRDLSCHRSPWFTYCT